MGMSLNETLRSVSLDYLNLLINGQAFSDVSFSVQGRVVHAHRCILAARSLFFRRFFCDGEGSPGPCTAMTMGSPPSPRGHHPVIPVTSVGYEVFVLMLQFLYSGQVSILPQKHEPRPDCPDRACCHTHCSSAVDLALHTLAAARSFGVDQLALLTQKQLAVMVDKASIEDVMKVLIASSKHDMHQLRTTCSHVVANSVLSPEILAKHLPMDVFSQIEELQIKSTLSRHHSLHHQSLAELEDHKLRRMRRALDSSDVELVKLMVIGEDLNLDEALALHYAVQSCSREVVKALLELGASDVNYPAGPSGKTPLHLAAEMVSPDMVAVLLDHHADPNVRTVEGITPLDVLRSLTSDFQFKGAVPGLVHIEPNKLRFCLELVQSAAMVISREDGNENETGNAGNCAASTAAGAMYEQSTGGNNDSRLVYLNLAAGVGSSHHHHHQHPIGEDDDHSTPSSMGKSQEMSHW